MWHSTALKRSLLQISRTRTGTNRICGVRRSLSQYNGAPSHGVEVETEVSNISIMSNDEIEPSNGVIRFTMTPKEGITNELEFASNLDGAIPMVDDDHELSTSMKNNIHWEYQNGSHTAAEHLSKLMENSYYYASFQAKASNHEPNRASPNP